MDRAAPQAIRAARFVGLRRLFLDCFPSASAGLRGPRMARDPVQAA